MWVEKRPKIGETVKIVYSEWYTNLMGKSSEVGVLIKHHSNRLIIDLGYKHIWLPEFSTIFVFEND